MKRMKTAAKSLLGQRSKSGQLSGSSSGAPIASGLPNNPVPLSSSTGPDTTPAFPKSDSESTSEDNSLKPVLAKVVMRDKKSPPMPLLYQWENVQLWL